MTTKKPRGRNGGRKPDNEERGRLVYVPLSLWQDQVDYLEAFGNRSAGARLVIDYVMDLKRRETANTPDLLKESGAKIK